MPELATHHGPATRFRPVSAARAADPVSAATWPRLAGSVPFHALGYLLGMIQPSALAGVFVRSSPSRRLVLRAEIGLEADRRGRRVDRFQRR